MVRGKIKEFQINKLYKEKIADNQPLLFIENYKISDVWGGGAYQRIVKDEDNKKIAKFIIQKEYGSYTLLIVNFSETILKRKICNDIFICSDLTFDIVAFKHYCKNILFEDCFLVNSLNNKDKKYHLLIFSNIIKNEKEPDGDIDELNNNYIKTGFLLKEEDFKRQESTEDMLKKIIERIIA